MNDFKIGDVVVRIHPYPTERGPVVGSIGTVIEVSWSGLVAVQWLGIGRFDSYETAVCKADDELAIALAVLGANA